VSIETTRYCDFCKKKSEQILALRYLSQVDLCDECMAVPQVKRLHEMNETERKRQEAAEEERRKSSPVWQQQAGMTNLPNRSHS
jgi:hydrogenase maturation factor HypF (carbamoyltransferase family)